MGLFSINKFLNAAITCILLVSGVTAYAQPTNHPTGFTATALSSTSIQLTWTGSTGATLPDGYLIVARITGGTFAAVNDGTPVPDDSDFTDPNMNGAVNTVHAVGANSATFTLLNPQTLYEFEIHAFTGSGATINYKGSGTIPTGSVRTFATEPSGYATSFTAVASGASQIDLGFSAASTITNADGYIILRKTAAAPDVTGVVDGVNPASLSLIAGTTLVTTVTNTATTTFSNSGLTQSNAYQYVLIPYNYDGTNNSTYNYKTDATIPLASASTPAPSAAITQETGGVATSVVGGDVNKAIIGFSAVTDGAQSLDDLVFTLTVNPTTGPLSGFRLVNNGASSAYSGGGTILGTVPALTATTVTFLNINQALSSSPTYFFLIADVSASGSGSFTATFTSASADVGSTSGTGFSQGPTSIATLNATLAQLATGIAPSPLTAGANSQAIIGFSLASNGSQTASLIKVQLSSNPAGKLSNFVLVASGDNSYSTSGDNTVAVGTGNITVSGSGPYFVSIAPAVALDISSATSTNFFLVANVNGAVTSATPALKPTLSTADITLSPANVTANSITTTTDYSFQSAQTSTITLNYGGQTSIDFAEYNDQTATGLTTGNSQKIFGVDIGDTDSDSQTTTITSLTLQLGKPANLKTIALFDNASSSILPGTELDIATNINGSNQITFAGLNYVVGDESTKTLNVYVTFNANVTDNDIISVLLIGATASPTGTGLAALGTVQTGGSNNDINVVSTKLIFNSLPTQTTPSTLFTAIVWATDANGILDVDATDQVNLVETGPGPGNITGGGFISPSSGVYTFNSLSINLAGTYNLIADDAAGGQALILAGGAITINSLGVKITNGISSSPFTQNLCFGGDFQVIGDVKIEETDPADFAKGGIFMLELPNGFIFDIATNPVLSESGNEVSFNTLPTYFIGNNVVRISYSVSGTTNSTLDAITISGLKVRYPSSTPTAGGNILVVDGSAVQVGNAESDAQNHGTLTASQVASTGFTFEVYAFPGQTSLLPEETKFSYNTFGVLLKPAASNPPVTGGTFSGNGVSFSTTQNAYVFAPASVGVGNNYDITYTALASGCQISVTKTFQVYATSITGLLTEYCVNDNTAQSLSVDPSRYDISIYYSPWNSATLYSQYNRVSYNNEAYECLLLTLGTNPSASPTFWKKVGYTFTGDYSVSIPSYKNITSVTNNGSGVVTITSPNHGFSSGASIYLEYYVYDASWNVIFYIPYAAYTIGNITTNTFDISYSHPAAGTYSNGYGNTYIQNPQITGVSVVGNNITITVPNHGLPNGSRVQIYLDGLSDNGVSTVINNWYTVSGVAPNTFTITGNGTVTGSWTGYGNVDIFDYRISSFTPSMVTTFNSNFGAITNIYVGFVVDQIGCVTNSYNTCRSFIYTNEPVKLNQLAQLDYTGLNALNSYCASALPVTLTGNQVDGSFTGLGITDGGSNNKTASFNPGSGAITPNTPFNITYSFTDNKNCATSISKSVTVFSTPVPPTPTQAQFGYCVGDTQPLILKVSGSGTDFAWYNNSSKTITLGNGPVYDASSVGTGSPITQPLYVTQFNQGCESGTAQVDLVINPLPAADFTSVGQCAKDTIKFTGPTTNIASWSWDFGDGNTSNSQNTKNVFADSKNYDVKLDIISVPLTGNTICRNSKTIPLFVGFNPDIKIGFKKICDGDNTILNHTSSPPLDSIYWDFGDGVTANGKISSVITGVPNTTGTYGAPVHHYPAFGSYTLRSVGKTTIGCRDTIQKAVPILKKLSPTSANPYFMMSANPISEDGYWQAESTIDSTMTWEFNIPSGLVLTSTDSTWITNPSGNYKPNDVSYVNSPCFDLTGLVRPLISIHYMDDTQASRDGSVLEYSTNSGLTWTKLGDPLTGIEWYNNSLINALGNVFGWSKRGDNTFKDGYHSLSDIPAASRSNVRFRIKFASDQDTEGEGFAFNNVNIVEKNRLMLVENFTNESAPDYSTNNAAFKSNLIDETVKIQYHLTFPGADNISVDNKEDPASRAAFYGLANTNNSVPRVYIDGESDGNFTSNWYLGAASLRSLKTSPFQITINTLPSSDPSELIVTASVKALQNVSVGAQFRKPIIQIAVIQKTIGANEFVLRKLLPNSAGTEIDLPKNTNDIVNAGPYTWAGNSASIDPPDLANLAIVVFVQDEITKEVYQAEVLLNPTNLPSVITGNEPTLAEQINIYPVPAQGMLNIRLPRSSTKSTPISLVDGFGREVYSNEFKIGEQEKSINTTEFASGVYIILIKSAAGEVARRKVIISN